jgi:hypothetical protein
MNDQLPTVSTQGELALDDQLRKMSGLGTENVKAQNILIPRLVILQALSPQVNKKKAEYIDGAEVGDFCNTATGDIYKQSVTIIPVYFITNYLEWMKNRGGLVNNFGDDPTCLQKTMKNEKFQNILPNGNMIVETAQWYCLLSVGGTWERIFFPMFSTNLKHSRKWLTLIQSERVPSNAGLWKPPLFWRSWQLSVVDTSNDQGDWFTFKPEKRDTVLELDPSRNILNLCMAFYSDLSSNKVKGDIGAPQDEPYQNGRTAMGDPNDKDIPF